MAKVRKIEDYDYIFDAMRGENAITAKTLSERVGLSIHHVREMMETFVHRGWAEVAGFITGKSSTRTKVWRLRKAVRL